MQTVMVSRNNYHWLFLLIVIVGVASGFAMVGLIDVNFDISHAIERHGLSDIDIVHNCLDKDGPTQIWYNPRTHRWAQVCKLDDTDQSWGIQIVQQIKGLFEEITALPRWETVLDEIERYLINRGYMLMQ